MTRLKTPVTIKLRAVDGATRTWTYKTVEGLKRWHDEWLGKLYDTTPTHYVDGYGTQTFTPRGLTVHEIERLVKGDRWHLAEGDDDEWERPYDHDAPEDNEPRHPGFENVASW